MNVLELVQKWGFLLLGGALVLVAFLVNRLAPQKRHRIRQGLILYVVFVAALGLTFVLERVANPTLASWAEHTRLTANLCGAFALVNVLSLALFDVVLPIVGVNLVAITGDIIVGFAYLFALLGVLKAAGVSPSSVVTTSAIVSGVLALGMQATLGNIVGGVALQLDGSVHVGDWIQLADGTQGRVVALRWRHTLVETRNWDTMIVPNASLLAQNILILGKRTAKPLQHRMWVYFHVDYRYPPTQVVEVVRNALAATPIPNVADDPKPSVVCMDLAKDGRESYGYYAVRYWLTDLAVDDPTSSVVRGRIYSALRRAGIPLARPAHTVFFQVDEPPDERARRHAATRLRSLEGIELFKSLTPEEKEFVAGHLRYAPFVAGETCTKQGAVAHWLYILCSGTVEIRRHVEGSTLAKTVATIEGPDFFGEFGLMTGEPRTADVVAITDVECYRLDKPGLQRVLEERPDTAEHFSKTLARRRVELVAAAQGLDEEAKRRAMATEEGHILDRIQEFFGLERTTKR